MAAVFPARCRPGRLPTRRGPPTSADGTGSDKPPSDDDVVIRHDIDGAVSGDVDDAAAHNPLVGQVDEYLIARALSRFRLVHGSSASAAQLPLSRVRCWRPPRFGVTRFRGLPTGVHGRPSLAPTCSSPPRWRALNLRGQG